MFTAVVFAFGMWRMDGESLAARQFSNARKVRLKGGEGVAVLLKIFFSFLVSTLVGAQYVFTEERVHACIIGKAS